MVVRYRSLPLFMMLLLVSGGARGAVYGGLAASVEGYAESPNNSYTANQSVVLGWRARRARRPVRQGTTDIHARWIYTQERESQKNDPERFHKSYQAFVEGVHPFQALSMSPRPWLMSAWGWIEGAENHQQLEEREFMGGLGLGLDKRIGTRVRWDLRAGLALACNEEEKDDDRPRHYQGIGRDQLNRRGCGWFGRWTNRLRLPTDTVLGADLDYYEGRFDYGKREYSRARVEVFLRVPLVSERHQLEVAGRSIRRHSELNLIGFEDRLNQVGLAYFYHF